MQRDHAGPVGPRLENRLIPDLGLRAGVREHDGALAFLDRGDDLRQHLRSEVTGPRKPLDDGRDERVDDDVLRVDAAHDRAR